MKTSRRRRKEPEILESSHTSTRRLVDVDDGSTVTDFLPAERARGVTIQSAAITFHWPPLPETTGGEAKAQRGSKPLLTPSAERNHMINLIDTPGHSDFTFEVIRSLRILDGAVCILDGVAGVEAQTEKVWYQAAKYNIPKIIYVNKLDRDGAEFGRTVREVASRLFVHPAVCQVPWFEGGQGRFCGLGDVVRLQAYRWSENGDGKEIETMSIEDPRIKDTAFADEIRKARHALIDLLSGHDDMIVDKFLEYKEEPLDIPPEVIITSLRRCVLDRISRITPIYCGASFRNIGVQPLLDAIVQLLPNPKEVPDPEITTSRSKGTLSQLLEGDFLRRESQSTPSAKPAGKAISKEKRQTAVVSNLQACALAFKVVYDARRGPLVYVRVYSGSIQRGASLYNTNLQVTEPAQRLLRMYASDSVDLPALHAGQIGVIPGLKHARTGDTLIVYTGANPKTGPPPPLNSLQLRPIEVPPAVFFSSIEAQSLGHEKSVREALGLLIREDPSLQLLVDEDSGQTLLSGMGEFHLEIAADRLTKDLKAKASTGKIEIAYREAILCASSSRTSIVDREIAGKRARAGCTVKVAPLTDDAHEVQSTDEGSTTIDDGNRIAILVATKEDLTETSEEWSGKLPSHLSYETIHLALRNGARAALGRGILYPFPFTKVHVSIRIDPRTELFGTDSSPSALSTAAREATKAALKQASEGGTAIMEHVMNVTVSTNEASLGAVINDLNSERGGQVTSLEDADATTSGIREDLPRIDLKTVYAPPDPFDGGAAGFENPENEAGMNGSGQRTVQARVPLREMMGYLRHLRSITRGRGSFVMSADCFERVVGQREKLLQKELRGY
ncbi:MAG: hypothetical protein Q9174_003963 [Haloplaca sp. 1 TL-2023]